MSGEDFGLTYIADITQSYVKTVKVDANNHNGAGSSKRHDKRTRKSDEKTSEVENEKKGSLLRRLSSISITLRPNFGKIRYSLRKVSCVRRNEEDEAIPLMDVPRKSIDIGVGLARKMSLFIFTKKSVCVHPYHPYVPKQTTRKIYICTEDK